MKLNHLDTGFSAFMLLLGLYVVWQSVELGILGSNVTGPGFFPFLGGLMISAGSSGVLFGQLKRKRFFDGLLEWPELGPVISIVILTMIYLLLIDVAGMVFSTPIYILGIAVVIERPRTIGGWLRHCAVAIGFTGFAYGLFQVLLNVPLPEGWLLVSS